MSMSGIYGKGDDTVSIEVIHRALNLGVNFLDTSDLYGWGHNEDLVGRAIQGRRRQAVLATKFGQVRNADGSASVNGRPEHVARACDASLSRLRVETIDLYYQHRVDPKVPIEETVGAMAGLVDQGKVRLLGLCEAAPGTIRRAHKVHPISAVQSEYSLLYRTQAEETLATLRELGIVFIAYSPLGRSLLTGRVQSLADIPEGDRRRDEGGVPLGSRPVGRGRHERMARDLPRHRLPLGGGPQRPPHRGLLLRPHRRRGARRARGQRARRGIRGAGASRLRDRGLLRAVLARASG